MTSYAAPTDLQARYPDVRLTELSDPVGATLQTARLQTALDDASAEMDSHLGRRYSLPLATVPSVLKRLCCDLAVYRLMALLPKESVQDARRRYDDGITWLDDLVSGKIQLADLTGAEMASGPSVRVTISARDRVFDADGLGDYQ